MHPALTAWTALLAALAAPARADMRRITPCSGAADARPCLIEGAQADRVRLPAAGPAAWVDGDRLVIAWVGEADQVRVTGNMVFAQPMPRVAPNLFQFVVRYPKARQTRTQLRFAITRAGKTESFDQASDLVGPDAYAIMGFGDIKEETIDFGSALPQVQVWLPPGYRSGQRYPILYLGDGGWTSPGAWLTDPIKRGDLAPLIVVGIERCSQEREPDPDDCRMKNYAGASSGPLGPEFLAYERFVLDSVIPTVEAKYGAPPERRLRAVGGASNGGVWTASMALRNPGVFGTAFVMSPGLPPAQHGRARPSSRFYISAGDLEPSFRWSAQCLAGDIVARGGVASFASYPSGHDTWMWGRIMFDNARDWLAPRHTAPVPAALPDASCGSWRRASGLQ